MTPKPIKSAGPELGKALERYLDLVNQLLVNATPIGAYCMGLSGPLALADTAEKRPTPALLKRLSACVSVAEGSRVIENWLNSGGLER